MVRSERVEMPDITIYTTASCPYCISAKRLLNQKGAAFTEIPVDGDRAERARMSERAGGRTSVPQIFIDGSHIGGCDDLYQLEREGRLDPLLSELGAGA
jgi:glutaredoxin 3